MPSEAPARTAGLAEPVEERAAALPRSVGQRLRELGLSPRKGLGQHFLASSGVVRRILEAAEVGPGDVVLEVGPGLGVLTQALAETGARVIALELDGELAAALARALAPYGERVRVLRGDAREVEPAALLPPRVPYAVVANLPYYAGTVIVRRFLEMERRPQRLVVMLQREVARQMVGTPGKLGLLGVGVQFYGRPRIVALVPPGAFYPPPKVTSAIVRIDVAPDPLLPEAEARGFFALVRAGFSAPRKQLRGAMSHALGIPADGVEGLLRKGGIEARRRAETLSLQEWAALYAAFRAGPWSR
jgi:16S rRNA (adenine1518-N6/adenine1519-N6)-dimethyltransferase